MTEGGLKSKQDGVEFSCENTGHGRQGALERREGRKNSKANAGRNLRSVRIEVSSSGMLGHVVRMKGVEQRGRQGRT